MIRQFDRLTLLQLLAVLVGLGAVAYLDHRFAALLPASNLYYLPILFAAIFFGYAGGLAAAGIAIALFHLTHFGLTGQQPLLLETDILRLALFLVVGVVTARLVEDRHRLLRLNEDLETRNAELDQANRRLEELSRARGDFVAVATHELKVPLATILGAAELLGKPLSADRELQTRLVNYIRSSARRLQRTVENLLDTALIESGRFALHREEISVNELLLECSRVFATAEPAALEPPRPLAGVTVFGDRDKLLQVLTNLVSNALKYSPKESPVSIAVESLPDNVLIAVSDEGYGISPEDLPHIFDRYYRSGDGRIRAMAGAGLGLSISREIVRAHGGDLTVRSEPGRGSTFTMVLPVRPIEGPSSDKPSQDNGAALSDHQASLAGPRTQ